MISRSLAINQPVIGPLTNQGRTRSLQLTVKRGLIFGADEFLHCPRDLLGLVGCEWAGGGC